jgi:rhomboid family protein
VRARLQHWALVVWHFVSNAPLTYTWLLALAITTIIQHVLTGRQLHLVLLHRYTNIHQLATDPLGVLFSSLFWIDGTTLEPYLLLFTLFLAPAEHWLGQLRWLTVGLSSHIVCTYISEGLLYLAIQNNQAAERFVRAHDIGVSYFLVGVMSVLTYHIARPWRWGYLAVLLLIFGFPLITMDRIELSFTAIGHFSAILVGLAFYPMARERKKPSIDPAKLRAAYRRLRSREPSA